MFRALLALLAFTAPALAQCIPEWTPGFGTTGVGGSISAEVVFDDGTGPALYAGGLFTQAGGISAKNIARWDGTTWAPLAGGQPSIVRALAAFDPDGPGPSPAFLYAGGDGALSRWDGTSWTSLPQPPDATVRALAVFDDGSGPALYAGGIFTKAGGSDALRIARWNGLAWSPLGAGTSGAVTALAVYDDGAGPALYAGGLFNKAGGGDASRIARWDGVSWSALKGGVSDIVYPLVVHDDGAGLALIVGGQFTLADGKNALHIARWDGPVKGWSGLGQGTDNNVLALASFSDAGGAGLVAGGDFIKAGGGSVGYVAQWRELSWSGLGAALDGTSRALKAFDDGSGLVMYVGGDFTNAGGVAASFIARWNGTFWSRVGSNGPGASVTALEVFDDGNGEALYAAGSSGGPMKWNPPSWKNAWNQTWPGAVNALLTFDDGAGNRLYAAGKFYQPDHVADAINIARWNGSTWSGVGGGVDDQVNALAVFDDGSGPALYAGGTFLKAGGNAATRIAKWNGLSWSALGSGLNGTCYTLVTFDDGSGPALYAAGQFTTAGGNPASNIARWNGLEWSKLGSGLNATARALAVHTDATGSALYVAGEFTQAGGQPAKGVAKWDGLTWSALDTGINGTGFALASLPEADGQSALFVGGSFPTAGGLPSSNIARWGCPGAPADLCELPPLVAPGGLPGDFFGQSVSISGDTMFVGAFGDDTAGLDAGAAQVFARSGGSWAFDQTLIPDDLIAGDFFGASAAVDGPFAIVGAPRADPAGANSGAAYIFRLDNGLWVQEAKLVPDDADPADQFGYAVDILGDTVIVGAWRADLPGQTRAGAAYIFTRELGAWVQKIKLTADDASADDHLGAAVALAGSFAIAGAPGDDNAKGSDAGAAYVFFRAGDQWGDWEKLIPGGAKAGDAFGFSVAGDEFRLVVGAPGSDNLGADAGLAYVYRAGGGHWLIEDTLFPSGLKPGDALGSAVAIRGPLALVGGYQSDLQGVDSGAASLFERDGNNWFETAKLTGDTIQPGDFLGASVAIGPSELAAGAINADAPGGPGHEDQGAVILYSTNGCPCYPDFTGDGALDLFDFLGYVNSFNAAQPAADCNRDGVLDLFDFLCFVNAFNQGCP